MSKKKRYTIPQMRAMIRPIANDCNVSEGYFVRHPSKRTNPNNIVEFVYDLNPWATSEDFRTFENTLYRLFEGQITLTSVPPTHFVLQGARENGIPLF